jgi:hypothetical protein
MPRAGASNDPSYSILSSSASAFNEPNVPEAQMLQRITDRDSIVGVLVKYTRMVDRFDDRGLGWEANGTGEIFWGDAECDFGVG